MAKLVFVFVLALIALQGSDAHLRKAQPRFLKQESNVNELIDELKQIIHNVSSRFSKLSAELTDKILEIETEANFPKLVSDFRQDVKQLMTQDGADVCETVAQKQVREVERLAAVFTCKLEVDDDMTALKNQLKVLASKVEDLLKQLGRDVLKCMKESHGDYDKYIKCMDQNIDNVKQELVVIEKEIEETFKVIDESIPIFTDKIASCVGDNKKQLVAKIQAAEETIKSCLNGDNVADAHLRKAQPRFLKQESNVNELIDELKQIIHNVSTRFSKLSAELTDKILEIETEANFPKLVSDFRQDVKQLMTQDGADVCETVAQKQVREVERLAAVFTCKLEVNDDMTALKNQLKVLASKVEDLLRQLGRDVLKCMKDTHGDYEKFTQCLDQNIDNVKLELEGIEKEIEETFKVIDESIPIFTDKIASCVGDNKKQLVAKIQTAEETIKSCLNGDNVNLKKSGFANVADYFKYLADEINKETVQVTVQLPEGVVSLTDKINEIISAHNLEAVIIEAKAAVAGLLAEHEQDERLCGVTAHEELTTLAQNSQAEAEVCVSQAQQVADILEEKLSKLADKSRSLVELLNEKILACAQEHLMDSFNFARCLATSTEELQEQVKQLQQEVEETLKNALKTVRDTLKDLDVCLGKVEEKTIAQGKLIVDTLNKCINNADLLF